MRINLQTLLDARRLAPLRLASVLSDYSEAQPLIFLPRRTAPRVADSYLPLATYVQNPEHRQEASLEPSFD